MRKVFLKTASVMLGLVLVSTMVLAPLPVQAEREDFKVGEFTASTHGADYVPDEVIVKFKPGREVTVAAFTRGVGAE